MGQSRPLQLLGRGEQLMLTSPGIPYGKVRSMDPALSETEPRSRPPMWCRRQLSKHSYARLTRARYVPLLRSFAIIFQEAKRRLHQERRGK